MVSQIISSIVAGHLLQGADKYVVEIFSQTKKNRSDYWRKKIKNVKKSNATHQSISCCSELMSEVFVVFLN